MVKLVDTLPLRGSDQCGHAGPTPAWGTNLKIINMRVITNFNFKHFGLGFRYSNWSPKRHFVSIDLLWFTVSINI